MKVHVAFLNPSQPGEIEAASKSLKEAVDAVVLVDVFRSSSTIVEALDNSAIYVMPASTVEKAKRMRDVLEKKGEKILLAGERLGITPEGFNLNISPLDMRRSLVDGKGIVYCSTNLTRILGDSKFAGTILIGGLTNAKAVARYLEHNRVGTVVIVACGTLDLITIEDVIGAGAIVKNLSGENLTDGALLALMVYENPRWREVITGGRVANYLRKIGFGEDLDFCIRENRSSTVPVLKDGRLVVAD